MTDGDVADRLESIEEDIEELESRVNRLSGGYVGLDKLREKVEVLEGLVSSEL